MKKLIFHPILSVVVSAFLNIASGIIASAFVVQITVNNSIQWRNWKQADTLWIVFLYLVILFIFHLWKWNVLHNVEKFADDEYSKGYIRSELLPAYCNKLASDLKAGKSTTETQDISAFIKESFK